MKVLELSRNESGIIINALIEFRNIKILNNENYEPINEIFIKIMDAPEKKSIFKDCR